MAIAARYKGYRYPIEVIGHAVWLYHRFALSLRDVEELMLTRGVVVTYETIRSWGATFGLDYANQLRRRRIGCGWSSAFFARNLLGSIWVHRWLSAGGSCWVCSFVAIGTVGSLSAPTGTGAESCSGGAETRPGAVGTVAGSGVGRTRPGPGAGGTRAVLIPLRLVR